MTLHTPLATAASTPRQSSRDEKNTDHARELAHGERFAFGENWRRFLDVLDEDRIHHAEYSVQQLIGVSDLRGRSFLDVGCGSGLFSLAARRLGARVRSFDFDPASVACTAELRRRYFPDDPEWSVEEGSILDPNFVAALGTHDVVYSWGVLHHTGALWTAIEQALDLVAPSGELAIAVYNDQGNWSRRWRFIKRMYCSGPVARAAVCAACIPTFVLRGLVSDVVAGQNPVARYKEYRQRRGMSVLHDCIDWLGGYPFEVAKPEAVFDFVTPRGFELVRLKTAGGSMGCNEFVFRRQGGDAIASRASAQRADHPAPVG